MVVYAFIDFFNELFGYAQAGCGLSLATVLWSNQPFKISRSKAVVVLKLFLAKVLKRLDAALDGDLLLRGNSCPCIIEDLFGFLEGKSVG